MRKHQINAETSKISNKHSKKKQMRKKKQKLNCSNFNPGDKMCFIPTSYKIQNSD